jgi:hypothetical protein
MNNKIDSLLFIFGIIWAGLLLYLISTFNSFKVYADLVIYLISFVGSVLAIYDFLRRK